MEHREPAHSGRARESGSMGDARMPPARHPEWPEEAEALHMVEMEVGETDVEQARIALGQPLAELANSGAGIEDQSGAVGELDLDTGGVAAVTDGRGSRRGQRSPRAPD